MELLTGKRGHLDPLLQDILNNPPEFVVARLPEAVTIRPSSYTVVGANVSNDENSSSGSSVSISSASTNTSMSSVDSESAPNTTPSNQKSSDSSSATEFYDINENPNDHGTRQNSTILKSWNQVRNNPGGLVNKGVTCYMNAAVQALVHVPAMAHYLSDVSLGKYKSTISPKSVTFDLAMLFRQLMDKRQVYPSKLIRRLEDINCMMSAWNMEDSHEYFMSLMSRVQEDGVPAGQKLNTSIMHNIFGGNVSQKVTCKECGHVSTTLQDLYDLPVSFSSKRRRYRLEDSIKDFFSPESIKYDTKSKSGYDCDKCKKQTDAVKVSKINDAPEYLAVHIKRFEFEGTHSRKLKDQMKYPAELDLSEFSVNNKDNALKYKLISVVIHHGRSVNSGHYVALCRQPNGSWTEYDDEELRSLSEKEVLDQDSAYMLVYSKLTPKPKPKSKPLAKAAVSAPAPASVYSIKKSSTATSKIGGVKRPRASADDIDAIFAAPSKKTKVH